MKKSNKKISILHILRLLVQIVFFIFLPSICMQTLIGVKQIYLAIINQSFSAALLPQMIEVIAIIPITILLGRFFCGWMCGFGSFTDFIYLISSKIFKKKFKVNELADSILKYVKYVVLLILVLCIWTLNVNIFKTANPWDVFGMLAAVGKMPDFSYVTSNLLAGFLILIGIIIASVFIERFFCRYLCPMGAIFAIVSKLKIGKIKKPSDKCGNCRICTNNCAMGIPLYSADVVKSAECINCLKCLTVCPRHNTAYTIAQNDVRPLLVSAVSIAVMTGSYYTADFAINAAGNNITSVSQTGESISVNKLYKDGTYQGTGTGFRGAATTVSVSIKNDKITNISTVSYGDDKPFYNQAYATVSKEIISSQSTDVDTVSGATFSSNGIMNAVADALGKAKISDVLAEIATTSAIDQETTASSKSSQVTTASTVSPQNTAPSSKALTKTPTSKVSETVTAVSPKNTVPSTKTPAKTTTSEVSETITTASQNTTVQNVVTSIASGKYNDGTYKGTGTGFRGATTSVSVDVSGGRITNITVNSYGDDRSFFNRAFPTVSQKIISSQSTDIDTVSGATFSSNGIMEAVANALSTAAK